MSIIIKKRCILIVNFGGPRNIPEIESFLIALLTDKDVVRTQLPQFLHNILFTRIAKKRSLKISQDYASIGGKSPIYFDTEALAKVIAEKVSAQEDTQEVQTTSVITFHRYLPATHAPFRKAMRQETFDEIVVFPLFPQFTYATTGSIARWFSKNLNTTTVNKMRWIKSYPAHVKFIQSHSNAVSEFLQENGLKEEETLLLFSAHGLPQKFVEQADPYQEECHASFNAIIKHFPKARGVLSFQSKFGRGEWLRPYTSDISNNIRKVAGEKKNVVVIPISFTSDHIETLFEVEEEYLKPIREQGLNAFRVPALTLRKDWIDAIMSILEERNRCNNQMLIR